MFHRNAPFGLHEPMTSFLGPLTPVEGERGWGLGCTICCWEGFFGQYFSSVGEMVWPPFTDIHTHAYSHLHYTDRHQEPLMIKQNPKLPSVLMSSQSSSTRVGVFFPSKTMTTSSSSASSMTDSRKCGGVGGRSFTVSSKYGRCVEVVDVADVADAVVHCRAPLEADVEFQPLLVDCCDVDPFSTRGLFESGPVLRSIRLKTNCFWIQSCKKRFWTKIVWSTNHEAALSQKNYSTLGPIL